MKMHIFVADENRDELKFFLEAMAGVIYSHKCTFATSPEQAIEMLKYLTPDMIFVDLNLANDNGIDVLTATRKVDRLKSIPIFVYGDYIDEQVRCQAMALGAAGCIEKKNTIVELTEALRDVIYPAECNKVA